MEWWLIGLTVLWVVAALWFAGRLLLVAADPTGGIGVDHFDSTDWSHWVLASGTLLVVPVGLGWAAHATGSGPGWWLLYLAPWGVVLLIVVFFLVFVPLINWYTESLRPKWRRRG